VPNFISIGSVHCVVERRKIANLTAFSTSIIVLWLRPAFNQSINQGGVPLGTMTMNLPLSNDIKIVSVFHRVGGAFTNFVIQKRDGQIIKRNTFSPRAASEVQAPPNMAG